MNEKLPEFYREVQIKLQKRMQAVLEEVDHLAIVSEANLTDLSFCVGSSFASILFELTREEGQKTLTQGQHRDLSALVPSLVVGFAEKLELLKNPSADRIELVDESK